MVVISVTIVESSEQLIYGIPKSVIISTSIPATVFYTLDGTTPNITSSVYTSELFFPTNGCFTFKVLATNGIDSSAVISRNYGPVLSNLRKSHDKILNAAEITNAKDSFPYSDIGPNIPAEFGRIGATPVHTPGVTGYFDGYDGTGMAVVGNVTDQNIDTYAIRYSESDWLGQRGNGIGTLPSKVTFTQTPDSPESAYSSNLLFNPRAKVIYQDSRDETDIGMINRPYFALTNNETYRDGALLDVSGADYVVTSGSFVTSRYNPVEKTMTYYYYDNLAVRWIISKEPFDGANNPAADLSGGVFSSSRGSSKVFKWYPFARRRLI